MRPKYEVGEVVLLRSVSLPERNGEYSVLSIHPVGLTVIEGKPYRISEMSYRLEGADDTNPDLLHSGPTVFSESALRKKHTPGEMTFDNLMASLSSPKLLTHQPQ